MSKTGVILLIIFCAIGLYDLFIYVFGGVGSTVSAVLQLGGMDHPAIIAVIFYILGHIFSPLKCQKCALREKNEHI